MNFTDLLNATSSPESAGGASPCKLPDGRQTSPYGLEAAPAKHSAAQEKAAEPVTTETYGRYLQISSASASLNTSLVNRLKQRFGSGGSIEYTETWNRKLTPSGVAYWAHTASTPRTSVSACTGERKGWPTPQEDNANNPFGHKGTSFSDLPTTTQAAGWLTPRAQEVCEPPEQSTARLKDRAETTCTSVSAQAKYLAGWPTPVAQPANGTPEAFLDRKRKAVANGSSMGICLSDIAMVAQMAGWPTASATKNTKNSKDPQRLKENGAQTALADAAWIAGWPTADCSDRRSDKSSQQGTSNVAKLAGWPTCQAMDTLPPMDYEKRLNHPSRQGRSVSGNLREVVTLTLGQMLSGGRVEMESTDGYRLNPHFSAWLMGYPVEWTLAGQRAASRLRQSKKARQSCSKVTATQ